jgi:hypothetical protein
LTGKNNFGDLSLKLFRLPDQNKYNLIMTLKTNVTENSVIKMTKKYDSKKNQEKLSTFLKL